MKQPLVSVVIPTYNRAYCLARTIDSVLGQTYPRFEILVVDDGSTDDTPALVRSRFGGEPRIKYIYQPNGGVAAARNRGIAEAQGDCLALLDSDDIWRPWKLELQVACLSWASDAGMVWTDMEAIDPAGQVFSPRYLREMYSAYRWFSQEQLFPRRYRLAQVAPRLQAVVGEAALCVGDIYSPMIMGNLVHTSTVLIRRDRLALVKGFNESLRYSGEDYDFHLRTCREGIVAFADVPSISYQRGMPDRLTRSEYAVHMARNFLITVTAAIERDRERITLPPDMLDHVQAEAHAWVGEKLLAQGEYVEARGHLLRSLQHRPFQPRLWLQAAASHLPPGAFMALRAGYRTLKWRSAPLRQGSGQTA
jgi:glycosyltransferase involved in cell wall biosynthesis